MKAMTKFYITCKNGLRREEGIGTVELILVLFVLIGIVIIFKSEITKIVESYFDKMDPNFAHPAP